MRHDAYAQFALAGNLRLPALFLKEPRYLVQTSAVVLKATGIIAYDLMQTTEDGRWKFRQSWSGMQPKKKLLQARPMILSESGHRGRSNSCLSQTR